MLEKVHGIVLRTVKYGDSSIIVDLFTKGHGRMSLMASASRSRRAVRTVSLWQPLSMVEFTTDIRTSVSSRLPRPTDAYTYYNYIDVPYSPVKSSLALFLAEFLAAALREEKENHTLYLFLENSLQWLDTCDQPSSLANFHLVFLIRLSLFMGIMPNCESPQPFFDLLAGSYSSTEPSHSHYLKGDEAHMMPLLLRMNYSTMHLFRFSRTERKRILDILSEYYRLHIPSFPELKSLDVLHELFD